MDPFHLRGQVHHLGERHAGQARSRHVDIYRPARIVECLDRDAEVQPAVTFEFGRRNEVMLVRACARLDPFFGTTPLVMDMPMDDTGAYAVVAASTFVNEP